MEGWQSKNMLDRVSYGFFKTSVSLHHLIRGVYCKPCAFFFQQCFVNNGEGSLSTEVKTKPAERDRFSIFTCMCVHTWQSACFANVIE